MKLIDTSINGYSISGSQNYKILAIGNPSIENNSPFTFKDSKGNVKIYLFVSKREEDTDELPAGWTQYQRSSDNSFYYGHVDGTVQDEKPTFTDSDKRGTYRLLQTITAGENGTGFGMNIKMSKDGKYIAVLEYNASGSNSKSKGKIHVYKLSDGQYELDYTYSTEQVRDVTSVPDGSVMMIHPSFDVSNNDSNFDIGFVTYTQSSSGSISDLCLHLNNNETVSHTIPTNTDNSTWIKVSLETKQERIEINGSMTERTLLYRFLVSDRNKLNIYDMNPSVFSNKQELVTPNILDYQLSDQGIFVILKNVGSWNSTVQIHRKQQGTELYHTAAESTLVELTDREQSTVQNIGITVDENAINVYNKSFISANKAGTLITIKKTDNSVHTYYRYDSVTNQINTDDFTSRYEEINVMSSETGATFSLFSLSDLGQQFVTLQKSSTNEIIHVKNYDGNEWSETVGLNYSDVLISENEELSNFLKTEFFREFIWYLNPFMYFNEVSAVTEVNSNGDPIENTIYSDTNGAVPVQKFLEYEHTYADAPVHSTSTERGFTNDDIFLQYLQFNTFDNDAQFVQMALQNPTLFRSINYGINRVVGKYIPVYDLRDKIIATFEDKTQRFNALTTFYKNALQLYSTYELFVDPFLNVRYRTSDGQYQMVNDQNFNDKTLIERRSIKYINRSVENYENGSFLKNLFNVSLQNDEFGLTNINESEPTTEDKMKVYWLNQYLSNLIYMFPGRNVFDGSSTVNTQVADMYYEYVVRQGNGRFRIRKDNSSISTLLDLHIRNPNAFTGYTLDNNDDLYVKSLSEQEYKDYIFDTLFSSYQSKGMLEGTQRTLFLQFLKNNYGQDAINAYITNKYNELKEDLENHVYDASSTSNVTDHEVLFNRLADIFITVHNDLIELFTYVTNYFNNKFLAKLNTSDIYLLGWNLNETVEYVKDKDYDTVIGNWVHPSGEGYMFPLQQLATENQSRFQLTKIMKYWYTNLDDNSQPLASPIKLREAGYLVKDIHTQYESEFNALTVRERYELDPVGFSLSNQNTIYNLNLYLTPFNYIKSSVDTRTVDEIVMATPTYLELVTNPTNEFDVTKVLLQSDSLDIGRLLTDTVVTKEQIVSAFTSDTTADLIKYLKKNEVGIVDIYENYLTHHIDVSVADLTNVNNKYLYVVYFKDLYPVEELKKVFTLADLVHQQNGFTYNQVKQHFTQEELDAAFPDNTWNELPVLDPTKAYGPVTYTGKLDGESSNFISFKVDSTGTSLVNVAFNFGTMTYTDQNNASQSITLPAMTDPIFNLQLSGGVNGVGGNKMFVLNVADYVEGPTDVQGIMVSFLTDSKGVMDYTSDILQNTGSDFPHFEVQVTTNSGDRYVFSTNSGENKQIVSATRTFEESSSSTDVYTSDTWELDRSKLLKSGFKTEAQDRLLQFSSLPVTMLIGSSSDPYNYETVTVYKHNDDGSVTQISNDGIDISTHIASLKTGSITTDYQGESNLVFNYTSVNAKFYAFNSIYENNSSALFAMEIRRSAGIDQTQTLAQDFWMYPLQTKKLIQPFMIEYDEGTGSVTIQKLGDAIEFGNEELGYVHVSENSSNVPVLFRSHHRDNKIDIHTYNETNDNWDTKVTKTLSSYTLPSTANKRYIRYMRYYKESGRLVAVIGLESGGQLVSINVSDGSSTALTYPSSTDNKILFANHDENRIVFNNDGGTREKFNLIEFTDSSSGLTYSYIGSGPSPSVSKLMNGFEGTIGSSKVVNGEYKVLIHRENTSGNEVGAIGIYGLVNNVWTREYWIQGWNTQKHFFTNSVMSNDGKSIRFAVLNDQTKDTELGKVVLPEISYDKDRTFDTLIALVKIRYSQLGTDSTSAVASLQGISSITIANNGDTIDLFKWEDVLPSNMSNEEQLISKRIVFETIHANNPTIVYYYLNDVYATFTKSEVDVITFVPMVDKTLIVPYDTLVSFKTNYRSVLDVGTLMYVPNKAYSTTMIFDIEIKGERYVIESDGFNNSLKIDGVSQIVDVNNDIMKTYNDTVQMSNHGMRFYLIDTIFPIASSDEMKVMIQTTQGESVSDFWNREKENIYLASSLSDLDINDVVTYLSTTLYQALDGNSYNTERKLVIYMPKSNNTVEYMELSGVSSLQNVTQSMLSSQLNMGVINPQNIIGDNTVFPDSDTMTHVFLYKNEKPSKMTAPFNYTVGENIELPTSGVLDCVNNFVIMKNVPSGTTLENGSVLYSSSETENRTLIVDITNNTDNHLVFKSASDETLLTVKKVGDSDPTDNKFLFSTDGNSITDIIKNNLQALMDLGASRSSYYEDCMVALDTQLFNTTGYQTFTMTGLTEHMQKKDGVTYENDYVLLHNIVKENGAYVVDLGDIKQYYIDNTQRNANVILPMINNVNMTFVDKQNEDDPVVQSLTNISLSNIVSSLSTVKCKITGVAFDVIASNPGVIIRRTPIETVSQDTDMEMEFIISGKFYSLEELLSVYTISDVLTHSEYTFEDCMKVPDFYTYIINQSEERLLVENNVPLATLNNDGMLNKGVSFDEVARDQDGNLNYAITDLKLAVTQNQISLSQLKSLGYDIPLYFTTFDGIIPLANWKDYFTIEELIEARVPFYTIRTIHGLSIVELLEYETTQPFILYEIAVKQLIDIELIMKHMKNILSVLMNSDDFWRLMEVYNLSELTDGGNTTVEKFTTALETQNTVRDDISKLKIVSNADMQIALYYHSVKTMRETGLFNIELFDHLSAEELYSAGFSSYLIAEYKNNSSHINLSNDLSTLLTSDTVDLDNVTMQYSPIQLLECGINPYILNTFYNNISTADLTPSEYSLLESQYVQLLENRSYFMTRSYTNMGNNMSNNLQYLSNRNAHPTFKVVQPNKLIQNASVKLLSQVTTHFEFNKETSSQSITEFYSQYPIHIIMRENGVEFDVTKHVYVSNNVTDTQITFTQYTTEEQASYNELQFSQWLHADQKRIVYMIYQTSDESIELEPKLTWNKNTKFFKEIENSDNSETTISNGIYTFRKLSIENPICLEESRPNINVYFDNRKTVELDGRVGFYNKLIISIKGTFEPVKLLVHDGSTWKDLITLTYKDATSTYELDEDNTITNANTYFSRNKTNINSLINRNNKEFFKIKFYEFLQSKFTTHDILDSLTDYENLLTVKKFGLDLNKTTNVVIHNTNNEFNITGLNVLGKRIYLFNAMPGRFTILDRGVMIATVELDEDNNVIVVNDSITSVDSDVKFNLDGRTDGLVYKIVAQGSLVLDVEQDFTSEVVPDTAIPICFLKGSMVMMGDGSKKAVQDVVKGDVVMTQNGPEKVVDTLYMKMNNTIINSPYRVGNAKLSYQHLVSRDGKLYLAGNIGTRMILPNKYIEYYHMKVEGGIASLLSVDDQWCESWDGYGQDVSHEVKGYIVLRNSNKECTRYIINKMKYDV